MAIKDPIILGTLSGLIAGSVKEVIAHFGFVRTGIAPFDGIEKAAGMIIQPYEIRTPMGTVVGVLMDLTVSVAFATGMTTAHQKGVLRINGLNGAFCGLGLWALMYGAVGNKSSAIGKTTPKGALATAGWHALYGAIAGSLISHLGEDKVHNATRDTQSTPNGNLATDGNPLPVLNTKKSEIGHIRHTPIER